VGDHRRRILDQDHHHHGSRAIEIGNVREDAGLRFVSRSRVSL
jgi:hypothetical protein